MLIVSIVHLVSLSIVIQIFAMIISIALHALDLLLYLIVWFGILIRLLVYSLDCLWAWWLYHFLSDCHGLYVCISDISCPLLDCIPHDYPSSAWLHVVCPCGAHIYPPTSNSLSLGHSLHYGPHYCKCEAFCMLVLWPSQRLGEGSSDGLYRCMGAFWRRATL